MDYSNDRKQILIMASVVGGMTGAIGFVVGLLTGGLVNGLKLGGMAFALGFVLGMPVVAGIWKMTNRSADVSGSVFFSAQGGKAAARGYSAERAMARDGREAEALEALWGYNEASAGKESAALWELIELARRHSLTHPLVARSAQRLLREKGLGDLDRRRLQEVLASAAREPGLENSG